MKLNTFIKNMILISLFLISISVMIGHYFNIVQFTSFGEGRVTMKFVTSFMFFISAIGLLSKKEFINVIVIITAVFTYTGWFFNEAKPLFLPVFENGISTDSISGDIPSWGTLILFALFGISNLIPEMKIKVSRLIMFFSVLAFLGHMINLPIFYFYYENISTGMAVNTSILFMHLAAYNILKREQKEKYICYE